jgi:hypothetical protein
VSEPREVAEIAASVNALLDRMQAGAPVVAAPSAGVTDSPEPVEAAGSLPPALPEPTTSTVTPPPARPDTFPPRTAPAPAADTQPAVEAVEADPAAPAVEKDEGDGLRAALEKLGDDLDTLLDNPELSSTQRHLILASIQNEYRRIVLLTEAG